METRLSTRALRKASYVVREMVRYYFPLYGLGPERALDYLTPLLICEAIVFDVDSELESGQLGQVRQKRDQIAEQLRRDNLLDLPVERELDRLVEYAELELKLVNDLNPDSRDVDRACALRTSDVRLLHRVLARLVGQAYEESYFHLMWPLEAIMDVELDLEDYSRDVAQGSFNTLILLDRMLGPAGAVEAVQGLLARYELMFTQRLAQAPPDVACRFLSLLARYQAEHPRPPIPLPGAPASGACLAEPRLL